MKLKVAQGYQQLHWFRHVSLSQKNSVKPMIQYQKAQATSLVCKGTWDVTRAHFQRATHAKKQCLIINNININNNNNRYLETLPIENYITALTKTEMHNKQQNLNGKATYTMFEKNGKRRKLNNCLLSKKEQDTS